MTKLGILVESPRNGLLSELMPSPFLGIINKFRQIVGQRCTNSLLQWTLMCRNPCCPRVRVGETITLTFPHCPPLLGKQKGRKEEQQRNWRFNYCFISLEGREEASHKEASQASWDQGKTCVQAPVWHLRDIRVFSEVGKLFLINRNALHLYPWPKDLDWYLDRSSHKLNMASMAIPSTRQTLELPHGTLEFMEAYIGTNSRQVKAAQTQRRELETVCVLLCRVCEAGVSCTYCSTIFFLAAALPVVHYKFRKCPHNVFFLFLTVLAPCFQLFPEIKKGYLMSTVEAAE